MRDNRIRKNDLRAAVDSFSRGKIPRFWELDFLRGLCVALMVFDHFMYSLFDVLPVANDLFGTAFGVELTALAKRYWTSPFRNTVRMYVICTFFILCGISCTLSKNNCKRGFLLAAVALGFTGVTAVIDNYFPHFIVRFGVLHMLACAVFAYALFDLCSQGFRLLFRSGKAKKIAETALGYLPALIGLILLILYFAKWGTLSFSRGYPEFVSTVFPSVDSDRNDLWSYFIYVKYYRFDSSDYFPLLPWAAIVLLGSAIGRAIYHTSARYAWRALDGNWNAGFCRLGRHAAVIYLGHVIIIPALTALGVAVGSLFV